jgi:hypothetical protein
LLDLLLLLAGPGGFAAFLALCLTFAKRKFEVCWSQFWLQLYFCLTVVVERLKTY